MTRIDFWKVQKRPFLKIRGKWPESIFEKSKKVHFWTSEENDPNRFFLDTQGNELVQEIKKV